MVLRVWSEKTGEHGEGSPPIKKSFYLEKIEWGVVNFINHCFHGMLDHYIRLKVHFIPKNFPNSWRFYGIQFYILD